MVVITNIGLRVAAMAAATKQECLCNRESLTAFVEALQRAVLAFNLCCTIPGQTQVG